MVTATAPTRRDRPRADPDDVRARRTREKLVVAFHELAREVAPAQMSVSALTRAAGVNRTSFYEHFASPDDLAVHALSDLVEVIGRADVRRRADDVGAEQASRMAVREVVDLVHARRASWARVLGPGAPPGLTAAVAEAFTAACVESLRRIPHRPPAADPVVTARFLAGGVLGVIGWWLAAPPSRWSRARLTEALVQCLPEWVLHDG